jgi:hypothetical protein
MKLRFCLSLALCLACSGFVAGDPPPTGHRWFWTSACPCTATGPNDYDGRPCPAITPISRCGDANDYCRKPLPTVPPIRCGGPDDYCKKPLPNLVCPPTHFRP